MFSTTSGSCAKQISASDSCISDRPWPTEPVADRTPAAEAPQAMPTASISLSAFMHTPLTSGRCLAIPSKTSVKGVMGYPAKNRQPAATMALAIASDPSMNSRAMSSSLGGGIAFVVVLPHLKHKVRADQGACVAGSASGQQSRIAVTARVELIRCHLENSGLAGVNA